MADLNKTLGISGGREDRELIIDDWGKKRLISRLVIDIMVFSSEEDIWPIFL